MQSFIMWFDGRIQLIEKEIWGDFSMLDGQGSFDHTGKTCCALRMADDGLDRSNVKRVVENIAFTETQLNSRSLPRISYLCGQINA